MTTEHDKIIADIEAARKSLSDAEAKLAKLNSPKPLEEFVRRVKPVEGQMYSFKDSFGDCFGSSWGNYDTDNYRWGIGNVWLTREEAEKHWPEDPRIVRCKDIMFKHAKGFVPDWNNRFQQKFHPFYCHRSNTIQSDYSLQMRKWPFQHLESAFDMKAAIDECGDDLKVLMGMV